VITAKIRMRLQLSCIFLLNSLNRQKNSKKILRLGKKKGVQK